ncbi:MAG: hypothetical protein GEU86_18200 [Actinophytocola sp.]|nr:hypothetical protein [Actinophytocola sp.]
MITWGDVTKWRASRVAEIGDALVTARKTLTGLQDELEDSATPKEWVGEGAEAAKQKLREYRQELEDYVAGLSALITRVDGAEASIRQLERAIGDTEELAGAQFFIDDSGVVYDAGPDLGGPTDPAAAQRRAEIEAMVEQILRAAEDIDVDLVDVIKRIEDGKITDRGATTLASAAKQGSLQGGVLPVEPPVNGTATQNAAWWATMTEQERKYAIASNPGLVGNLDGLPMKARSEANELFLPQQLRAIEAQIRKHGMTDELAAKLQAINEAEKQFDKGKLLVKLDLEGDRARAIIADANVDSADHVGVFVPGMNSTVEGNLGHYVKEMNEVGGFARDLLPESSDETVAMVTWLDYEPPGTALPEGLEGPMVDRAIDGSKRLAGFYEGLAASRGDDPVNVTAVGHSYGSLTQGLALRQTDEADSLILQGSPGHGGGEPFGAPDSSGIAVPDGKLYDLSAKDDWIADIGLFGGDPDDDPRFTDLETGASVGTDDRSSHGIEGHVMYTEPDDRRSTSEYNTAAIIAGREEVAIRK